MATFVSTLNFTEQGIKAVQDTTKRAAAAKVLAKKMGVKINNIFWTLGSHDGLIIMEAPDDETATSFMLRLAALGNVTTTTSRAFTAAEMDTMLSKLSG